VPNVTPYAARFATPDLIERDKAQTLTLEIFRDGVAVVVTSGTLDLFKADSTLALDVVAVTITDGNPTYSLLAATVPTTEAYSSLWREEWLLVIDGETIRFVRDAHLVRRLVYPVIGQTDILRRHSDLVRQLPQDRTSWQHAIDEAWDTILGRLFAVSKWPYVIVTPWALREVHLYESLAKIIAELTTFTNGRGRYAELRTEYADKADTAWARVQFDQDVDQDGATDDRTGGRSTITTSAGNPRTWRGSRGGRY